QCFVCGRSGATVICAEPGCERSFHLPCAPEGQCVTQFFGALRSFCREHSPQQAVQAAPAPDTTCVICMEPVGDSRSYTTMVCPACQHAWFHRACIQEQALRAGIYCFRCPACRNKECFLRDMLSVGIRIPFRKPTWEDNYAYSSLGIRYQRCNANICLYPLGRGHSGEGISEPAPETPCEQAETKPRCSELQLHHSGSTGVLQGFQNSPQKPIQTSSAGPDKEPLASPSSGCGDRQPAPKTPHEPVQAARARPGPEPLP
ncbi:PHD finger protein 7-like, partial [Coturnix japonica]|uniref:PHD finger protein 7-like n=1 Tax=Coturnix japonica TaxID=93934 RepID=UPI0013A5C450